MIKRNIKGQFIKGSHTSSEVQKGEHRSPKTEFKIGDKIALGNKRPDLVIRNKSEWMKKKVSKAKKGKPNLLIRGKNHPNWKNGIRKSSNYYWITKPNHLKSNGKYVKRCILIAEKCLGRNLNKEEIVHHIGVHYPIHSSENKGDDTPENLYLFSSTAKHTQYHFKKNKPILKSNLMTYQVETY